MTRRPISDVIAEASLKDYASIRDYGNAISEASRRLKDLGDPLPDWFIADRFLRGLGLAYSSWTAVLLSEYSARPTDADGKTRYPTVKDMVASLLDWEISKGKDKEGSHRALYTKSRGSGSGGPNVDCKACLGKHAQNGCWVKNRESWEKNAPEWLKKKFTNWQEAKKDGRPWNQIDNNECK